MPEILFLGGPHDGLTLSSGLGTAFLWTDGKRCFRAPARNRTMYRRMGADGKAYMAHRYRYYCVEHTHVLCDCGVFRPKGGSCRMCGAT